ncbi:P-loop containing nucleoside triphosphate hydrolase protein [Echria macrotheca]|uniref:P-loop containing nucleoside triphosphate hydrolase protein n=1 Tax=Echria macrotheca TaxID=438768 RepID=A0AAJ0F4U1_9PEZI|nr:P-loop containing nucleoside triphosphate hydrolase protein [Echria macrotheca]
MDNSHHPASTKRLGIPDLLNWEVGDEKRARLGLGEDFESCVLGHPFSFTQRDGYSVDRTISTEFPLSFGSPSQAFEDNSEAPEIWMSDAHTPWTDSLDGLNNGRWLPEPLAELVCFGMICDSKGQLLDDREVLEESGLLSLPARQETYALSLSPRDRGTFLQLESDELDVAVLDEATAQAFSALARVSGCEIDLFMSGAEFRSLRSKFKSGEKKTHFNVSAVIYGPPETREEVGRVLSNARLYLQDPTRYRQEVSRYDNPHRLELGDTSSILPTTSKSDSPLLGNHYAEEIETILKNLDHSAELRSDARISSIVKTKLNRHQELGVNFVAQREGRIPNRLQSLWAKKRINNIDCYEHVIIPEATRSLPENESVGGILADEMGLGKTLTMLAAIVDSIPEAIKFCGNSRDSVRPQSKATIVIAPSALVLEEWLSDINDHLASQQLRVLMHHGNTKAKTVEELLSYDIVLSTYATLANELRRGPALTYEVTWFRVILDEAHYIRHDQTRQYQAAAGLSAKFRWCLTGTPIQNRLSDLGSLISFLRAPLLQRKAEFDKHIARPLEDESRKGTAEKLRLLLQSICLRRTKELINLPEPKEITYDVHLSDQEKRLYKLVGDRTIDQIEIAHSSSKGLGTRHGLQMILHLRRLCNHGTMDRDIRNASMADEAGEDDFVPSVGPCLCLDCDCEIVESGRLAPDGKRFLCADCYGERERKKSKSRKKGASSSGKTLAESNNSMDPSGHSTKLSLLVQDAERHRNSDKCIIFSAWTKTLDFASHALSQRQIPFRRIDGNTSTADRKKILNSFQTEGSLVALLMTFGTGAVGLNITAATRVHILEPQWNPFVEKQAIGRALRYGQDREVSVVRYIVPASVESHIRDSQKRKVSLSGLGFKESSDVRPEIYGMLSRVLLADTNTICGSG